MSDQSSASFNFPDESSVTQLVRRLTAAVPVSGQPVVSARRCFLDTIDWRLFAAGFELECLEERGRCQLRLHRRADEGVVVEIALATMPTRASDLPAGALRERLEGLSGGRALLRRTEEQLRLWRGELSNRHGKVVARVEVAGAPRQRGAIATVRAVRGFGKWSRRLSRCLGSELGGEPWGGDALLIAANGSGVSPGDAPRWRLEQALDPDMRSDAAMQQLLAHYTEIMVLNLDGTRRALDPEFLHDFRIGIRRIRTLLRRVPGVFAQTRTQQFSRDFAWLGAITSPVRDLDVYEIDFPRHLRRLEDVDESDLAPFISELAARRERAQATLAAELDGARFGRRFEAWQRFLAAPLPRAPRREGALRALDETAEQTLSAVARKLYRQGDRISDDSPAEAYHDIRKTGKNLRYLYDAFESLLPRKHVAEVRSRLKELQDVLGAHQDLEVQSQFLLRYAEALDASRADDARTHAAALRLADHLDEESLAARTHFAERYRPFRRMKLHKRPAGR